jgi:hypothetical protein
VAGFVIALVGSEFRMFQVIALSIALTLAAGPAAAQFCKALCSPDAANSSECHHDASTGQPSVASDSNCDRATLSGGAFLREEVERPRTTTHASDAVCTLEYHVPLLTTNGHASQQAAHHWSLAGRPLTTALRI